MEIDGNTIVDEEKGEQDQSNKAAIQRKATIADIGSIYPIFKQPGSNNPRARILGPDPHDAVQFIR